MSEQETIAWLRELTWQVQEMVVKSQQYLEAARFANMLHLPLSASYLPPYRKVRRFSCKHTR